jgi:alpha-D-ribose 1-methylphosphonate 5-triphosphate synthase subunit PhnG
MYRSIPETEVSRQLSPEQAQRQRWLAVLARANTDQLEIHWAETEHTAVTLLRQPETGLVMARGRAGGTGQRFNLGEITVTRCAVQSADGHVGHGYVAGRDKRKAELVASFDALLQAKSRRAALLERVVEPLAAAQAAAKAAKARKAAATRVEFFTLVRGEE